MVRLFVLALLLVAAPARAEVSYTITLTDDENAALLAHTDALNARSVRGVKAPVRTPTQVLHAPVRAFLGHAERSEAEEATRKPAAQRTDRERRVICRREQRDPCP